VADPPLVAMDGTLPVGPLEVSPEAVARCAADPGTQALWQARLMHTVRRANGEDDA
jgi:hypothetical protein